MHLPPKLNLNLFFDTEWDLRGGVNKYEPRKDEGRKIVVDQLCHCAMCVKRSTRDVCTFSHFS